MPLATGRKWPDRDLRLSDLAARNPSLEFRCSRPDAQCHGAFQWRGGRLFLVCRRIHAGVWGNSLVVRGSPPATWMATECASGKRSSGARRSATTAIHHLQFLPDYPYDTKLAPVFDSADGRSGWSGVIVCARGWRNSRLLKSSDQRRIPW